MNDRLGLALSLIGANCAFGQCDGWEAAFGTYGGTSGLVTHTAATTWDPDGSGPLERRLVAFATDHLSRKHAEWWDGASWKQLGQEFNLDAFTMSTWDPDGPGPQGEQLVCGGQFTSIGGQQVSRIARWDGAAWQPFGTGLGSSSSQRVYAIQAWDPDGPGPATPILVAGGSFTTTGTGAPAFLAAWDGSSWQPLGGQFNNAVRALMVWDPDGPGSFNAELVAAGDFRMIGTESRSKIARWNGATWLSFASGFDFNAQVNALTTWDPDAAGPLIPQVVAGGFLVQSPGHIARWNVSQWEYVGIGVNNTITGLASWDSDGAGPLMPQLVAGGIFNSAGGVSVSCIASWNGANWRPLAGGLSPSGVAVGLQLLTWHPSGALEEPPKLVEVGRSVVGWTTPNDGIATWDGAAWAPIVSVGIGGPSVRAVVTCDLDGASGLAPQLFAGGEFAYVSASGQNIRRISRWDGMAWRPLGTGIGTASSNGESVDAVIGWDADGDGPGPPTLVVGGSFLSAGGTISNNIALWDGLVWQPLGSGTDGRVRALASWDADGPGSDPPLLIAGGDFATAGGVVVNGIAKWDGAGWSPLGVGMVGGPTPFVYALAVTDSDGAGPLLPKLVAGGPFDFAGGQATSRVAVWTGNQWLPIGTGMPPSTSVTCLVEWDPDATGPIPPRIVAGGTFAMSSPKGPIEHIAVWDGLSWRPLGGGVGLYPLALHSWDPDGSGPINPQLIAGGLFITAGGETVNHIARWTGTSWVAMGTGMTVNGVINTLATWDPDGSGTLSGRLVAGGDFVTAGSTTAAYVAAWTACAPPCYSNCDGSTLSPVLTANDFQCFLNKFAAGDSYANCDASSVSPVLTANDFQCFMNKYAGGCP